MSLQNQWISLYTEVFKLQKDMAQDGSLFPDNKAKLPLSVRIKCFFRIIKIKKHSNSIDQFSKKDISSPTEIAAPLQFVRMRYIGFRREQAPALRYVITSTVCCGYIS